MRTYLIFLAAALSLVGFIAASAASPGGGGGGGGGSSGGGSGGGGGHAGGGGGGHAGGGHGGSSFGGGGRLGGGSGSGSYAAHGGYAEHGGYSIVGYNSAGLGHANSAPGNGHSARSTLAVGPRTGSAAKAMRVTHTGPYEPPRPGPRKPPKPLRYFRAQETSEIPGWFCIPTGPQQGSRAFDCPQAIKTRIPAH